jgi:hypothetical protein
MRSGIAGTIIVR